jgi:hypothetical protein
MLYRDSFRRFIKSNEYKRLALAVVPSNSMVSTNV